MKNIVKIGAILVALFCSLQSSAQILEASYPYHVYSNPQQWMDFAVDKDGNIFGCISENNITFPNGLPGSGSGAAMWYKIDSNGDAEWAFHAGSTSSGGSKILEIEVGEDNSIWVSGYSTTGLFPDSLNPGYIYSLTYFIAKMNQDGSFANITRFPNWPQFGVTENGQVAFAVGKHDPSYLGDEHFPLSETKLIYGLLDQTGNVLWRDIIPAASTSSYIVSDGVTKDGKFIFSGIYDGTMTFGGTPITLDQTSSLNQDHYIVSLNLANQQIEFAAGTEKLRIRDIAIDDGGYIYTVVGHYDSGWITQDAYYGNQLFPNVDKSDSYILKLNPDLTYNTSHNVAGPYNSNHPSLSVLELVEHNGSIFSVGVHDWTGPTTIFNPGGTNYGGQDNRFVLKLDSNLNYQNVQVFPGGGGKLFIDENQDNVYANFNGINPFDTTGFNHNYFFAKIKTNANLIKGRAYKDFNQNQIFDLGDVPINGSVVSTVPPVLLSITNPDGTFEFYVDSAQYTIELPSAPLYYSKDPVSASFSMLGYNLIDSADLRIVPVPGGHDLELDYFSTQPMRVGDTVKHKIIVKNQGTFIESGTVKLFPYNYTLAFDTIFTYPQMYNATGYLGYDFVNLALGDTFCIDVSFPVDTNFLSILNEISTSSALVEIPNNDTVPTNNYVSLNRPIVAAYDPNIKLNSNDKFIHVDSLSNFDYISYTVHFQNEGNFPATHVEVKDEILEHLDILSLQLVDYSHPMHATINGDNITFHFDSIMLAPMAVNEQLSKGYVHFKIKKEQSLVAGDSISNKADIYFDYNPAIITNYAVNYIIDPILVNSISVQGFSGANSVLTGYTLQMIETVSPANADDPSVTWSVTNGSGTATIDASGLLTGGNLGLVTVTAIANDGSGIFGSTVIEVTDGSGVLELNTEFEVYPNPTSGIVNLEFSDYSGFSSVKIYNVLGQIISETFVNKNQLSLELGEATGVYYMELVKSSGHNQMIKVIKQ